MSAAVTVGAFRPSFRWRLAGFDRQEVLAFCGQVIREYERAMQDLEKAQYALQLARDGAAHESSKNGTTSQAVERILSSAQRVADEIESCARSDAAQTIAGANDRAGEIVKSAEQRAGSIVKDAMAKAEGLAQQAASVVQNAELHAAGIIEDAMNRAEGLAQQAASVVQSAEQRAAGIIEDAMGKAEDVAQQLVKMQTHYAELRAAFELAADTAANALNDLAVREHRAVTVEAENARD